jgi:hypothetical protein
MQATLRKIKAVLRERMHERVSVVGQWLKRVVEGYYRYHAVPGNTATLGRFRDRLCNLCAACLGVAASAADRVGNASAQPSNDGYLVLASCILILTYASTPLIQGRSRVR